MARYDRIDEAVIHAAPEDVWEALRAEFTGETSWWLPELGFRPLDGATSLATGAAVEVVPGAGRTGRRRSPFAFVSRVVEVVENERLSTEYLAGAFRGTGDWTLEPVAGGTRLRMHWQVRTQGRVATLAARLLDIGEQHSKAMQAGFARLDRRLAAGGADSRRTELSSAGVGDRRSRGAR
jgi:uncharacterized protein YndB with AHSA1/START domain